MKEQEKVKNCGHISGIRCDVTSCVYHDGASFCTADQVKIGPSFAVCSTQTICATYRPRALGNS